MSKWRFVNWIFPGEVTWCQACWLLGGSVTGSDWWARGRNDEAVESLCVLGFCFEKRIEPAPAASTEKGAE